MTDPAPEHAVRPRDARASAPELGQILFAPHSISDHPVPEYVAALLDYILSEFDRIYWNRFQTSSPLRYTYRPDQADPDYSIFPLPDGTQIRSFWWGDENDPAATLPNFEHAGVTIHWYKHPGRSMTTNTAQDAQAWTVWFNSALTAIRATEATPPAGGD
jgi:hypothetical protein